MVAARSRRSQVVYAMKRGVSQRTACRLFSVARSTLGYRSRLAAKDAPALMAMRRYRSVQTRCSANSVLNLHPTGALCWKAERLRCGSENLKPIPRRWRSLTDAFKKKVSRDCLPQNPMMPPNKSLQLALMDPASVSLPQNAHRVKCATELGC